MIWGSLCHFGNIICSSWSNRHCEWSRNPIIFWEMISHLTAGYRIYVKDPFLEDGFGSLNPAIEVAWESSSGKVFMRFLCPSMVWNHLQWICSNDTVAIILMNGNDPHIWKLSWHWLRGLPHQCIASDIWFPVNLRRLLLVKYSEKPCTFAFI